jgi:hypothetical protein
VSRRLLVLGSIALLAAGCGVRNSNPFTAKATATCLRAHGFHDVTTDPAKIGFVAAFAPSGGIRAIPPSANVLTIAFAPDPSGTASIEQAFRQHAPKSLRPHLSDIMSANRNAVLLWTITPMSGESDIVNRCLRS